MPTRKHAVRGDCENMASGQYADTGKAFCSEGKHTNSCSVVNHAREIRCSGRCSQSIGCSAVSERHRDSALAGKRTGIEHAVSTEYFQNPSRRRAI